MRADRLMIAALLGGAVLIPAAPATAQMACGDRDGVVTRLQEKYGEARQGVGLGRPTEIVELWASEETGSWTLLVTRTDGMSCVVAAGEHWQAEEPEKAVLDSPA
ncbi:MAG: hypothetical protein AAF713_05290 [Pseudomonadota bacterium]